MTENSHDPRDPGDQSGSIDGEMVVALTELDVIIEKHIRGSIGDYEYEAYMARSQLEGELDESIGQEVREAFGRPIDRIFEQEAELAKRMIDEGMDETEAHREAARAAYDAMFAARINPLDADYMEAFGDITDIIETSIQESLIKKYPNIEVTGVDEAQLSLIVGRRSGGPGGGLDVTLHVAFSVDGASVLTTVFYSTMPRRSFQNRALPQRVDLNPAEYNNVIGGVDLEVLKKDALQALRRAIPAVS